MPAEWLMLAALCAPPAQTPSVMGRVEAKFEERFIIGGVLFPRRTEITISYKGGFGKLYDARYRLVVFGPDSFKQGSDIRFDPRVCGGGIDRLG